MECRGKKSSLLFGIPKILISEDTLFMKNMLLYFFEVATTRFMDNIKENMSRGSSTAKENHPSLRIGPPQFRELQLHLHCSAMILPSHYRTNLGYQACDLQAYIWSGSSSQVPTSTLIPQVSNEFVLLLLGIL